MAIYNYADLFTDTDDGTGDKILTLPEEIELAEGDNVLLIADRGKLQIIHIPELIEYVPFDNWIPQEEMQEGAWYFCRGRNFTVAQWTGTEFRGERHKFGASYWATEYHWDQGAPHGTVKPFKKLS